MICVRQGKISEAREASSASQKRQADEMLQRSNKKFAPVSVGQNVLVRIPDVDRGRAAPRNVMAVVMEWKEDSNLYKLGTPSGVFEKLYARNEFQVADHRFIDMENVPEKKLTLRTVAAKDSQSKQGFVRCGCKNNCATKRCNCLKKEVRCNSKCHSSSSCRNK